MRKEFLKKVNNIVPNISKLIEVQEIATPYTFFKFTGNNKGALFGWSALTSQIDRNVFPSETSIENLFLTGHWVTNGVGQASVSLVSLCGRNTARKILQKFKKRL